MVDGYNSQCAAFDGCSLSALDFLLMTASGDVSDIMNAVGGQTSRPKNDK